MKKSLLFLVLLFLTGNAAAQISVNTTSEWEDGSFSSVVASGDEIFLNSEIPSLDWEQTNFDEPITEITVTEDYVYAVSGQNEPGKIAKIDKSDGSFVWQTTAASSLNRWNSITLGDDGYLYVVELDEGIYRLEKDGTFNSGGIYPIEDGFDPSYDDREFDVEYINEKLYLTGGDGWITKFNSNDGSIENQNRPDRFSREIEIYNESIIYQGGVQEAHKVNATSLDVLSTVYGLTGSLDAIERGPEDDLWIGDNEGVYKYTPDLTTQICSKTDYTEEVPGMAEDFGGVYTSSKGGDRFNKLEGVCEVIWEESPSPKGYDTLEADGRALYAGAEEISGSEDGSVDKFFKEYDATGNYESKEFNIGSGKYLDEARINTTLNGQEANFTLTFSESSSFAPGVTRSLEYELSDGLNTFDLADEGDARLIEFEVDMESQNGRETPRVHWVEIDYLNSPPGNPPVVEATTPEDDGTAFYDPTPLEVNVTDPDGDDINVTFREKGGTLIEKVENVPSGNNASTSWGGFTPGDDYTWWANITDEIYDVGYSFNFTYDPLSTNNLISDFQTNYTSVMASTSEAKLVPYRIRTEEGTRDVTISINDMETSSSVSAEFIDGTTSRDLTLDTEGETVLVRLDSTDTGKKDVVINVQDNTLGTSKNDRLEVMVRDTPPEVQRNSVPGIQTVQLIMLLFMSSVAYFALL